MYLVHSCSKHSQLIHVLDTSVRSLVTTHYYSHIPVFVHMHMKELLDIAKWIWFKFSLGIDSATSVPWWICTSP